MRKLATIVSLLFLVVGFGGTASAALTNGGFENGLNGWTPYTDNSNYTSFSTFTSPNFSGYVPIEGNYFGVIGQGNPNLPPILSSLSQTVSLTTNDTLSGYAAYYTPLGAVGYARVEIYQMTIFGKTEVANPWFYNVDNQTSSGWQFWTWTPSQSGDYILSLEIDTTSVIGNNIDTFAFFDANAVVPLPGSLLLLGSGLLGLGGAGWRRRGRS